MTKIIFCSLLAVLCFGMNSYAIPQNASLRGPRANMEKHCEPGDKWKLTFHKFHELPAEKQASLEIRRSEFCLKNGFDVNATPSPAEPRIATSTPAKEEPAVIESPTPPPPEHVVAKPVPPKGPAITNPNPLRQQAFDNSLLNRCKRLEGGVYDYNTTSIVNMTEKLKESMIKQDTQFCAGNAERLKFLRSQN